MVQKTWIGTSGGLWGQNTNWSPNATPGTLDDASIPGPTGSTFEVIAGGGVAASLGLTGNVSLGGVYALGNALTVGSLVIVPGTTSGATTTLVAGALALSGSGSSVTAGSVNVVDGTVSLAGSTNLASTGAIAVGRAGGSNVAYGSGYLYTTGASSTISLAAGATLSTQGDLSVASGSLTNVGGTVSIAGALSVGTVSTPFTTTPYNNSTGGQVTISAGGVLTVGGAITDPNGFIGVSGTGSKLTASGILTAGSSGSYSPTVANSNNTYVSGSYGSGSLIALAGGAAQLGGVVFTAPARDDYNPYTAGLWVDATSTIEIGTVGGAIAGAITVDAGKTITANANANLIGALVVNGTVAIASGTLTQFGGVSGSGTIQIGKNATLVLNGTTASSDTIAFLDTGAALSIGTNSTYNGSTTISAPYVESALLTGFQTGDSIIVGQPVTTATYTAGTGSSPGTLVLSNGSNTIETLLLAGDFTNKNFFVSPTTNGASISLIAATPPVPSPTDPLFDPIYYLANNSDVAAAGVDPYQHYMVSGWKEGRDPSALFNTKYYLDQHPDVKAAGINPLSHFETNGWKEGRDPSAAFSDSRYLAAYPDVKAAGIDPLVHYVVSGKAEGRTSFAVLGPQDALVNAAYVYAHNPAVAAAGLDATAWYHSTGWKTGTDPNAFFDTNYYLKQNQDVKAAGVDPLAHFETSGWQENRQPSLVFDDAKYLAANADVKVAGIDPLLHYITSGQSEGRLSFITGGTAAADPLVNAAYYDQQLGASLIPTGTAAAQQAAWSYDTTGWQKGLNPDAFFDTNYYLSHNSDVAAAHIDPLMHYENNGWKEGRDPSATFSTNKYLAAYGDVKNAGLDPLLHYVAYGQGEGRTAFSA